MRQLVSVMTDETISYHVHDGDHTTQIAQVLNVGLGLADVITLGVNLGDVLRLSTMKLNGSGAHAVEPQERRALPPATQRASTPPKRLKAVEPVRCRVCSKLLARRTSYTDHLVNVHHWKMKDARIEKNRAPAADAADADADAAFVEAITQHDDAQRDGRAHSEPRRERGKDGRLLVPRRSVLDDWPKATPAGVYAAIEAAGAGGISIRELALQLTDDSNRGRQTIGNKLQTLRGQGVVESFDGVRPHYKTGTPTATMLVRIKR